MACALCPPIERVDVDRELGDVAALQVGDVGGTVAQVRIAEERGDGRPRRRGDAIHRRLDLRLHLVFGQSSEVAMRPGMGADGVPLFGNLADEIGVLLSHLAYHEERCLGALRGKGGENRSRRAWNRSVVEGQHDLARRQEVRVAMRCPEPGSARRINLDGSRNAEGVGGSAALRLVRGQCRGGRRAQRTQR